MTSEKKLNNKEPSLRPFSGSLDDAEGLLAVERATFAECPYSGQELCTMLTDGPQRAWVAVGRGRVVGFVIAFATLGLRGQWWEIDLLAVKPAWRGRRLATRLIRAAVEGAGDIGQSRAVVATDNAASARAFVRVGFEAGTEKQGLLVCRAQNLAPRRWSVPGLAIREAASLDDASAWLASATVEKEAPGLAESIAAPGSPWGVGAKAGRRQAILRGQPRLTLLLAEREGQLVGHAELVQVQTLLYRGLWIESLAADDRIVRESLVHDAVRRAQALGIDEVGAMVPESNQSLRQTLPPTGFRSLGDYYWLRTALPLPAPSASSGADMKEGHG